MIYNNSEENNFKQQIIIKIYNGKNLIVLWIVLL